MSKIKVLVVPSDKTGVGKFRSVDPHIFLQNLYGNDFHVDIIYDPSYDDMNFWKGYQIVAFHRSIGSDFDRANILIQKLNEMGIPVVSIGKDSSEKGFFNINKPLFNFDIKDGLTHNERGSSEKGYFDLREFKMKHRKDQIIRNCVDPNVGKYIFDIVKKINYEREKIS
jgi:hypothetical protein